MCAAAVAATPIQNQRHDSPSKYVNIGLTNGFWVMAANIVVGTPGQYIQLEVDTGSSDTWLISNSSNLCDQTANCILGVAFDASESPSLTYLDKPFNATYFTGASNTGTFVQDQLSFLMGPDVVGTIRHMTLGLADQVYVYQSFLGLGFDALEETNFEGPDKYSYPGILRQLMDQGTIDRRMFGLYMNDINADNGSLTLGGIDYSKMKHKQDLQSFHMVRVESSSYTSSTPIEYAIQLDALSFTYDDSKTNTNKNNEQVIIDKAMPAFIDSGFYYLAVPSAYIDKLAGFFNATFSDTDQEYICSCDAGAGQFIKYTFGQPAQASSTYGSLSYYIPASDFVYSMDDGTGRCALFLYNFGDVDRVQVGAPFLRYLYTVFDQDEYTISFAEARLNVSADHTNILAATALTPEEAKHVISTAEISSSTSVGSSEQGGGVCPK